MDSQTRDDGGLTEGTYSTPREEALGLDDYWLSEQDAFKHHSGALRREVAFGNALFQFFQTIVLQSRGTPKNEERAVFELIHAATRHFGAAVTLAARGCTSEVLALMRSVVEALDDARRVHESPELAKAWLLGPEEFRESAVRLKLWRFQGLMRELRSDYDRYCEYGSHPNIGVAQALFDISDPATYVLSFRKGNPDEMRIFLLSCGLAGYKGTTALAGILWPNVRPPEIIKRMDELRTMRDELLKAWTAMRRTHRLVSP
jgi:hypothetical protein